jgi:hypothetical protein
MSSPLPSSLAGFHHEGSTPTPEWGEIGIFHRKTRIFLGGMDGTVRRLEAVSGPANVSPTAKVESLRNS